MRCLKLIAFVALLLFSAGMATADELKTSVDFGVGYRADSLDWNIPYVTNSSSIDPYAVGEYDHLDTIYAKSAIRMSYKKFRAKAELGYGRIMNGQYQESLYNASGYMDEFSRVRANTTGWVLDSSISVGFEVLSGKVELTPLVGYSWHIQDLQTSQAYRMCDTNIWPECVPGHANYDFEYEARWQGPWIGLDVSARVSDKMRLFGGAEYHWGEFSGDMRWPSIDVVWGFDQTADAEGVVLTAGLVYNLNERWDLGMEGKYTHWTSDPGIHETSEENFFLNEAEWESWQVMFNATYRFYEVNKNNRLSKL